MSPQNMQTGQNDNDGFDAVSPAGGYQSEPLVPFDVREQTGRRSIMILAGVILALLTIALVIFLTYQPGTRDRDIAPRISADKAPFKVAPDNPGGAQTPDQDKAVYDVMAGKDVNETVSPAPGPEQPLEMPSTANIQLETDTQSAAAAPAPIAQTQPKVAPAKPAPKPISNPVASGGSDYVVQIASVRNEGDARDLWDSVSTKFSGVITRGLYSDIKRVDLDDKGIYYRLRVAGLRDEVAAKRLCDQFKARGQACLVARR